MGNGNPGLRRTRDSSRNGTPAHIRRCRDTLEWIDREKGEAEVRLDNRPVGRWRELQFSLANLAGGLRLSFRLGIRGRGGAVVAVQTGNGTATIVLQAPRGGRTVLRVEWERQGSCEPSCGDDFEAAVLDWVSRTFPRGVVVRSEHRSRLIHSLSGAFRRLTIRVRGSLLYVLAASPDEDIEPGEALTQALLWLVAADPTQPARIVLLVPVRSTAVLCGRTRFLDPRVVRAEVWAYEPSDARLAGTVRAHPPGPPVENRDYRWPLLGDYHWSPLLGRVMDLAPRSIRRHPRFSDSDSLRISGLEFARVCGEERDRIEFGIGPVKTELCESNFEQLSRLVDDIHYYRRHDSPDTSHPLYRAQTERWLESLILDDVDRLFPELQPASVYSQIPVYLAGAAGRADVIGVDREGTLVVLELKVLADPGLPLQALDYRARASEHNRCGDFEARGYFAGTGLTRRPPRACLVAPLFEFHDSTERLGRFFDPSIDIWKIGINGDWRSGVRVLLKRRLGAQGDPDR